MSFVFKARTPYTPYAMGSLDRTAYMLIWQHDFPNEYTDNDKIIGADHDRLRVWHSDFSEVVKRHTGTGELGIGDWVRKNNPEKVMAFLIELMHADPLVQWTGYRVMGSVHQGNGYPVFSINLFAKHPESKIEVYSGDRSAPNIEKSTERYDPWGYSQKEW